MPNHFQNTEDFKNIGKVLFENFYSKTKMILKTGETYTKLHNMIRFRDNRHNFINLESRWTGELQVLNFSSQNIITWDQWRITVVTKKL